MSQSVIRQAGEADIPELEHLDSNAQFDPDRRMLIHNAVLEQRCWVSMVGEDIAGYGVLSHGFFGRSFIEMIYIKESHRSRGFGPEIILYLQAYSQSDVLFTSTNESNSQMQHVLEKLGFKHSGIIHNLDPGDPEIVYCKNLAGLLGTCA